MIRKELAFLCERSGTVPFLTRTALRNPAPPAFRPLRGFGGGGTDRRRNRMEDSVKLTETQQRLLAAASQRDDRALERPPDLTGGAAGKAVAKLVTEGLIEEIQSRGSVPVRLSRRGQCAHLAHHQGRTPSDPGWRDDRGLPKKRPSVIAMLSRPHDTTIASS
jgi:hypothetical protein